MLSMGRGWILSGIAQSVHSMKPLLTQSRSSVRIPGDFVKKVKQINNQSDLISMSSFAGPSYLTIRSSVYIILT